MSNHYHLLIETPKGNLSKGMQLLNGIYTQKFNRLHHRVGHVFQGRFKGILVQKDNYLLELSRYIILNPVRAKMVASVADWTWSSYLATIHPNLKLSWLSTDYILSLFSDNVPTATKKYQEFIREGIMNNTPWAHLKNQIYLGTDEFVQEMLNKVEPEKNLLGIPKIQYTPNDCMIEEFEKNSSNRNECMRLAYESGRFTLGEIGNYFGLHYSTVSRIVKFPPPKKLMVDMQNSSPAPIALTVQPVCRIFADCNLYTSRIGYGNKISRVDTKRLLYLFNKTRSGSNVGF